MALKVVIVDGVLDSKRRKRKEQEGERGNWLYEGTAMNDGRSALPPASSIRHLGHIIGAGLIDTTAADLIGEGGDVYKRRLPSVGRMNRDSEAAESEVHYKDQVTTPPTPHQDRQRQRGSN